MAAEGLTNREIGQKLYVSHRTVGAHRRHVFRKLGVASRRQLKRQRSPAAAPQASDMEQNVKG
jgi:DNA-binding CsgD family transcriptional regulator